MELLLKKTEILDLGESLHHASIICQSGSCWLTQSDDPRDHILTPGKRFYARQKGRLLVTAVSDCRLLLEAEPAPSSLNQFWRLLCANHSAR